MTTASTTMAKAQKTTPVRLTDQAIMWARIASGYTGESMTEYVSRIVTEKGMYDVRELHGQLTGGDVNQATIFGPPLSTYSEFKNDTNLSGGSEKTD